MSFPYVNDEYGAAVAQPSSSDKQGEDKDGSSVPRSTPRQRRFLIDDEDDEDEDGDVTMTTVEMRELELQNKDRMSMPGLEPSA
jgi:hypothetical protein